MLPAQLNRNWWTLWTDKVCSVFSLHFGSQSEGWMTFLRYGNMENCRSCRWKSHSQPDGKRQAFSHRSVNSFPTASQSWQFTHIPTTPTAAAIHPFLSNPKKILWKSFSNWGTVCTPVQIIWLKKKREYSRSDEPKSCTPILCAWKCLKSSLFLHVPASRPTHEKS